MNGGVSVMSDDYWRGQVDARLDAILTRIDGLASEKTHAHSTIESAQSGHSRRIDKLESRWDRALGMAIGISIGAGAIGGGVGAIVSSLIGN